MQLVCVCLCGTYFISKVQQQCILRSGVDILT